MFRFDPGWKTIESFRALYDTIVALQPDAVPEYLLGPGIEYAGPLMRPIQPYKHRHFPGHSYDLPGGGRWDDLWDLYAVSRISDHLLLAFQSFDLSSAGPHVARWLGELLPPLPLPLPESGHTDADEFLRILESASQLRSTTEELRSCFPKLTTQVYVQFFEALGFEHCSEQNFSPYYHEIVEVEETGDEADGVELTREIWPGLRFGDMMFARAGVSVKCPPTVMTKPIAERSTLYWAHKRARRPTEDLSLGWGHDSQWGTDFRRDYEDAEHFYFNVDGAVDLRIPLSEQQEVWDGLADLSLDARRELLVHRCFVKCPLRHDDRWPYADTLVVAKNLPL